MSLKKETHKIQSAFAEYCRTGEEREIKGARQDRLHHYRRLTHNIVKNSLSNAYPITKKTLAKEEWDEMVNSFHAKHKMETPLVWKMPYEFYEFAEEMDYASKFEKPYLNELLYFEWMEIEIHTMPDKEVPEFKEEGDILEDNLVINPEFQILNFEYPVHKSIGSHLIDKKGDYFVLIFRKINVGTVKFIELSPFFALTLQLILDKNVSANEAIKLAANALGIKDTNKAIQHGLAFYNDLAAQGFVLGYQK